MSYVCGEDGYWINTQTGEVTDEMCIDANEITQDVDLEHYSITPPVPYVPQKYVERMKERNLWLKGKEKFIDLINKMNKVINYYEKACIENCKTFVKAS